MKNTRKEQKMARRNSLVHVIFNHSKGKSEVNYSGKSVLQIPAGLGLQMGPVALCFGQLRPSWALVRTQVLEADALPSSPGTP